MSPTQFEANAFREALGCFATGVTVISSVGRNRKLIGITANSFSSVSLDPPLVLFSLGRSSQSWYEFLSTQYFAVNVLNDQQRDLSTHFACSGEGKWSGVEYDVWDTGCPILPGAIATFECEYRYTTTGVTTSYLSVKFCACSATPNAGHCCFTAVVTRGWGVKTGPASSRVRGLIKRQVSGNLPVGHVILILVPFRAFVLQVARGHHASHDLLGERIRFQDIQGFL